MATRKSLKNKADRLWKEAVWRRDSNRCRYCGIEARNAHHIVGKRNHRLRWELDNGINLCPEHHTFSSTFSAHQTPTIFGDWFKKYHVLEDQHIKKVVNEIWDKDYEKIIKRLGEL